MAEVKPDKNYPPVTPPTYKAALPANTEFEFVSAHTIFPYEKKGGYDTTHNIFTQVVYVNGAAAEQLDELVRTAVETINLPPEPKKI